MLLVYPEEQNPGGNEALASSMGESEKHEVGVDGVEGEEKGDERENLMEGMATLDFDMLCSTVALQTQGKWTKLGEDGDFAGGAFGGVLRMWEGEVLDCFDDHRIAIEAAFCPCYRFGKNTRRAGFGSCLLQGMTYLILAVMALLNCIAFLVTWRRFFLYLAAAFAFLVAAYVGFFRTRMKKKFNIRGSDNSVDDCVYHLICPCCTLCQESRTLEMNNVQDGVWHGRGDTICIGRNSDHEASKCFLGLHPPPPVTPVGFPTPSTMNRASIDRDFSRPSEAGHSEPLAMANQ